MSATIWRLSKQISRRRSISLEARSWSPQNVPRWRRARYHHLCLSNPSVSGINNLVYPCNAPVTLRRALRYQLKQEGWNKTPQEISFGVRDIFENFPFQVATFPRICMNSQSNEDHRPHRQSTSPASANNFRGVPCMNDYEAEENVSELAIFHLMSHLNIWVKDICYDPLIEIGRHLHYYMNWSQFL